VTVVHLRTIRDLEMALIALGKKVEKEAVQGMRNAARFGVAAAIRTGAKERRRPKASGTYERSWLVHPLDDGATVSNSAKHAIFVERGRRPGRRPPLEPILEWVYQKRLAPRSKAAPKRIKGAKRSAWHAEQARNVMDAHDIAEAVRWKIARKGTPGRYILRKTVPMIGKRATLEMRRAIRRVVGKPPKR
jgi:hypothetical protein